MVSTFFIPIINYQEEINSTTSLNNHKDAMCSVPIAGLGRRAALPLACLNPMAQALIKA